MQYRTLGRTGIKVSEIGMGCEGFAEDEGRMCKALVDLAADNGVNYIDVYTSSPLIRSKLGEAMLGRRDKFVLQAHLCTIWEDNQYKRTRNAAEIETSWNDLLDRLQTDYIDIGMIHFVDSEEEWEGLQTSDYLKYIMGLKAEGKIRHIGMSSHNPDVGLEAAKSGLVEMMLFCVNPAYDLLPPMEDHMKLFNDATFDAKLGGIAPERAELYRLCAAKGVGITVMKAYAGGRLLDAARSPFRTALTPVQCLHYALTRPAVASVLVGYDTPEHVDAAAHYEKSTAAERDYATVLAKAPRHSFDGECTYCDHCAPCSVGIPIGTVNKLYDLAVSQPAIPDSVREHYASLARHAGDCTACGLCERRCPFHVKIAERMRRAAKLFGN